MPKQLVRHQISGFAGQNSAGNRDSMLPNKGRLVYNFTVENNILKKIPGSVLYINSGIGTDPVRYLNIFKYKWIYQIGGNLITETAEGSQNELLIDSTFAKARLRSDEWRGRLYLANGTQLRYYDGTNINELGILPPGAGTTPRPTGSFLRDGGSGSLPAGEYDYTFTYFDPVTQTESLPIGSLVGSDGLFTSTIFDSAANPTGWIFYSITILINHQISIQFSYELAQLFFASAPLRATQLNMYRRDPAQSTFRLVNTFSINALPIATAFIDNTILANLGVLLIPDQLNPPPTVAGATNGGAVGSVGVRYLRFWRDVLFMTGASFPAYTVVDTTKGITNTNLASDSILYGSDTFLPDYYPFNYEMGNQDGQKPTGLAVAYDTLMALKERSIYVMLGSDVTNYVLKIMDTVRGCIAPGSLQETPIGAIFLAEDGICICNAATPAVRISQEIDDEIKSINTSSIDSICSQYDRFRSSYRMYFPTGTSRINNRYVEYNIITNSWNVGNSYNATASAYGIGSKLNPRIMIGKQGGRLIDATNRANPNDDGQTQYAIFRSDEFDFGDRGKRKKLVWLYISAACSVNFIIDIKIYADYAEGPIYELDNYDSASIYPEYALNASDPAGSVYDTGNNENIYGGSQTYQRVKIPIQGVGRTFYLEIQEHQNNAQRVLFDIHSIEIEGVVFSK